MPLPLVFGKLGVLKGKKATCYPGFDKYLEGAEYTGAMVERDGNIVTGQGTRRFHQVCLGVGRTDGVAERK